MIQKVNPFVKARYEHGYRGIGSLVKELGIPLSTATNWETGRVSAIQANAGWANFHKYYKALGWSKERAIENLENVYKWTKDPNIELIKPNWDDYKNIVPYIGINPNVGDDVTDTTTSHVVNETNPLKAWRHANHYSVEDAAKLMEFSPITLSDIEDGVVPANAFCLRKIVDVSGLSFHQITKLFVDNEKERQKAKKLEEEEEAKKLEEGTLKVAEIADPLPMEPIGTTVLPLPNIGEGDGYETLKIDTSKSELSQRILDIVYGKVSLEEYREIEHLLGRQ